MTDDRQPITDDTMIAGGGHGDISYELPALDDLFKQYTDSRLVKEATAFGTLATGTYQLEVNDIEIRPGERDLEYAQKEDTTIENKQRAMRHRAHLTTAVWTVPDDGVASSVVSRGNIFVDVSWVEQRTPKNRLDGMSQRWGQFKKAIDPANDMSDGEVLKTMKQMDFLGKVEEIWIDDTAEEGERIKNARTPEDRAKYGAEGRTAKNIVRRVWLPK